MNNPWNTKMEVIFDKQYKQEFTEYYEKMSKLRHKNKGNELIKKRSEIPKPSIEAIEYFKNKYFIEEYGLKMMARMLDLSYSKIRLLFGFLNLEFRTGTNVITKKLKEFRSERVKGDKNPFCDWPSKCDGVKYKNNSRGIQGYWKSKNNGYIWLRSSWEYIYAKWLDKNNINWKFESKQYKLSDGTSYRPDFFILDENNNLEYIVEIKGYFKNRGYKPLLLEKEYQIKTIIIDSINDYCKTTYKEELNKWKQEKLSKNELNELT